MWGGWRWSTRTSALLHKKDVEVDWTKPVQRILFLIVLPKVKLYSTHQYRPPGSCPLRRHFTNSNCTFKHDLQNKDDLKQRQKKSIVLKLSSNVLRCSDSNGFLGDELKKKLCYRKNTFHSVDRILNRSLRVFGVYFLCSFIAFEIQNAVK